MLRLSRLVAVLAACGALACWPARASADQQTAAQGAVQATFTFDRIGEYQYRSMRLAVSRNGQAVVDQAVSISGCEEPYCLPGGGIERDSIAVRDVDGDGEPEVLLDMFTGGAHCCVVTAVLRWTGAGYQQVERNWADPGYRLVDLDADGIPEFSTADARFAYAFASFADSGMPIRLLRFRGGGWRDVTSRHPAVVRKDATRWMRTYRKRRNGPYARGVLAAWVADQYRLGRRATAHGFLAHELRAGRLRGSPGEPSAAAFIRQLERRLRAWRY